VLPSAIVDWRLLPGNNGFVKETTKPLRMWLNKRSSMSFTAETQCIVPWPLFQRSGMAFIGETQCLVPWPLFQRSHCVISDQFYFSFISMK